MGFENRCRTCLRVVKGGFAELTDDVYEFLSQDLGMQNVPKEHSKLQLPQIVCFNCNRQIVEFQRFLIKCREVNNFFKSKLEEISRQIIENVEENQESDECDETFCTKSVDWTRDEEAQSNLDCENQNLEHLNESDEANFLIVEILSSVNEIKKEVTEIEDSPKPKTHTKTGGRKKECSVCGRRCQSFAELRDHENIHKGIKPYCCDVCGRCFTQSNTLVTHQKLHFGKTVECDECGKKFARNSELILHDRVHRDEKPFECDFEGCTAKFRLRPRLLDHQAYHTGVRKFRCEICGNSFFHKKGLGSHMYKSHPKFSYQCDVCFSWFLKPSSIQKHMNCKHEVQLENVQHLKKAKIIEENDGL